MEAIYADHNVGNSDTLQYGKELQEIKKKLEDRSYETRDAVLEQLIRLDRIDMGLSVAISMGKKRGDADIENQRELIGKLTRGLERLLREIPKTVAVQ